MEVLINVVGWIVLIFGGGIVFLGLFGDLIYRIFFRKICCQGHSCEYSAKVGVIQKLEYKIGMKTYTDHGGTDPYSYRSETKIWSCPECGSEILTMKV